MSIRLGNGFLGLGPFSYIGGVWERNEYVMPEEDCACLIKKFIDGALAPWIDGSAGFLCTYYDAKRYINEIKAFPHSTPMEWLGAMEQAGYIEHVPEYEE